MLTTGEGYYVITSDQPNNLTSVIGTGVNIRKEE